MTLATVLVALQAGNASLEYSEFALRPRDRVLGTIS